MTVKFKLLIGWLLFITKIICISTKTTLSPSLSEDDIEGGWETPDPSSFPEYSVLPGSNLATQSSASPSTILSYSEGENYDGDPDPSSIPEYSVSPTINFVNTAAIECSSEPCQNGGHCVEILNDYECNCPLGYTGKDCQQNIDDCLEISCQENAKCIDLVNDYECICNPGYQVMEDNSCISNTSDCSGLTCPEGQICVEIDGSYDCQCTEGFTGHNCLTNINECESRPCQHGGTCYDDIANFTCQCPPGFTGHQCQVNIDDCMTNPCLNGGQCHDGLNNYTCHCPDEFMGRHCEDSYDACASTPCFNGASCITTPGERKFYCECLKGFEGLDCSHNINDCSGVTCREGKVCFDLVDSYECRCPAGFSGHNCLTNIDECESDPCFNGGTCHDGIANYSCSCQPGYKGHNCQDDVDECDIKPCNNGICINTKGSYECYCRPGFSGDDCSLEFDECLYLPCQNGGTCINKINSFLCECPPGFTGTKCEVDIDECASNPCQNEGTCLDGIASFTCYCLPGFTDNVCATNIDECESNPCQNMGQCIDGINEYSCNCSDTGFKGDHCDINIDDCLSDPCQHESNCTDLVKDYNCSCYVGYTGKNCEEDIKECASSPCQNGGQCYEYSDMRLYETGFFDNFSYESAGGFLCECQLGFEGELCQINIDECASNPCQNGLCDDGINAYECRCYRGYEGIHCEKEINECDRFLPCVHGNCTDKVADYECECVEEFGGKNCSVELLGCRDVECLSEGTCFPLLFNETYHDFECQCKKGFTGRYCEQATTFSLNGNGYLEIDSQKEIRGYDLELSFRTTLPNVVLAVGQGKNHYFTLVLHGGRLKVHSSFLNRYNGIFLDSNLNDGSWQRIRMLVDSKQAHLSSNNETTMHSLSTSEHDVSFTSTFLGGATRNLRLLFKEALFTGCFQDVILYGQPVVPARVPSNKKIEVEEGCSRVEQCLPNPCENNGRCIDLWTDFECDCKRPFLGNTCKMSFTPATFGNEDVRESMAIIAIPPQDAHKYSLAADISLLLRTREKAGLVFYFGSSLDGKSLDDGGLSFILARIQEGQVLVSIRLNEETSEFVVKNHMIDDGKLHLLQVSRNKDSLFVTINGRLLLNETVPESEMLAEFLYVGGIPFAGGSRVKRQLGVPTSSAADAHDEATNEIDLEEPFGGPSPVRQYFKGVLQDIRIASGNESRIIELFPIEELEEEPFVLPGSLLPAIELINVLNGTVSDNTCSPNPCLQGGICTVTFNDFECDCPTGFKGKRCDELEYCALHSCPLGAECRSLADGYECVNEATFNGRDSSFFYRTNVTQVELNSFSTLYRSKVGGVLFSASRGGAGLWIALSEDSIFIHQSNETSTYTRLTNETALDGQWHELNVTFDSSGLRVSLDNTPLAGLESGTIDTIIDFDHLVKNNIIHIGGLQEDLVSNSPQFRFQNDALFGFDNSGDSENTSGGGNSTVVKQFFRGCLNDIRIEDILLPFYSPEELSNNTALNTFIKRNGNEEELGCRVCFEKECENNGFCSQPNETFACSCLLGFEGDLCEINIDECVEHKCENDALCVDGVNEYICDCSPGYEGTFCELEIDECLAQPCQNGGSCLDKIAAFECLCPEDYIGNTCNELKVKNCSNKQCLNGATCHDVINPNTGIADNYTCECPFSYTGVNCHLEVDFCQLKNINCIRGYCSLTHSDRGWKCLCEAGFEGDYCERETNECLPEPVCLNGGTCDDLHNGFRCHCQLGWEGEICEKDINECEIYEDICNGGVCFNAEGLYYCDCPVEQCGQNCTLPNPCSAANETCNGNGECVEVCDETNNDTSYFCKCYDEWEGEYCEEVLSSSLDIWIILLIVLGFLAIIFLIVCGCVCRTTIKRRETSGTYSPSKQEFYNPRVEMGNMMQPPPEERLI